MKNILNLLINKNAAINEQKSFTKVATKYILICRYKIDTSRKA